MSDKLPLIAGVVKGDEQAVGVPVVITTGQVVNGGWSGRFVTLVAAGTATICIDSSATISGWIESGSIAAAAGESRKMILGRGDIVFRIPCLNAAYTSASIGDLVDLIVSGGVQYANIGTNTHDLLRIVGGYAGATAALSYVDVVINNAERFGST